MVEILERDITSTDANLPTAPFSEIANFFAGTNVFITGGTGFLGKLIIEKILRSCSDVNKIYILIREKKGKTVEQRLQELLDNVIFEHTKREQPKLAEKIVMVIGDCTLPELGLSEKDRQKLIDEIHCVFHCAATVRFDEKIRKAAHINVRATRDLLLLAKEMKQLKAYVHISTAFSFCTRKDINEEIYDPPITGEKLLTLVETLDEDVLDKITPMILGKFPNTYALTKAVAEEVVKTQGKGLPVALVRPAIVVATCKEPLGGWIDNMYGATGVTVGAALGLIRTLHCIKEMQAELVPADFVVNCTIAAAWDIGRTKDFKIDKITDESRPAEEKTENDIPVFNYVCSTQTKINWQIYMKYAEKHLKQVPSPLQVWHYCFILNSNYYLHLLCTLLLHKIPAYIVDFLAFCIGKNRLLVKGYKKIDKFMDVLAYFTTQEWNFNSNNVLSLWNKLNPEDKKDFDFDMRNFDWDTYFHAYARGGRMYLMKDPMDTLPQGRIKYLKLQIAHYVLVGVLLLGFFKMLMIFWNVIF